MSPEQAFLVSGESMVTIATSPSRSTRILGWYDGAPGTIRT
jgi:hypothetical protein